ncbi:MAG: adenosylcobinamide-GDP ribazoletransferase [Azoarcus sp.]|jgi:adenosylcobinamide-GDP ribazoletransferase|nr:adenosylcobinamide-GDP ribazoletransferase [Azoarcus sp.]
MTLRGEVELFFGALRFFTRLPVPAWVGHSPEKLDRASRYFPAVGLIVGGIGAAAWWIAHWFWPPTVAVLFALAATVWTTGAFHEDGLTDTADGFGGGWDKLRILDIMKDSRVGAFGLIAFVFVLLGRFLALASLPAHLIVPTLFAAHAASRFFAIVLLRVMDYVREDALAKSKPLATHIAWADLCFAALTALAPCLFLPFGKLACALALAVLVVFYLARLFRRWLGGYTGDCLGAVQQATELAFYLGVLAHAPQAA